MDTLHSIDFSLRATIPGIITFIFVLLSALPVENSFVHDLLAPLGFVSLCFWAANAPQYLGKRWAFFFGLVQDVLTGGTVGAAALAYTFAALILKNQKAGFLQPSFMTQWILFAILMAGSGLMQWAAASLAAHDFVDIMTLGLRCVLGIFLYPAVAFFLNQVQHFFIGSHHGGH